MVELFPARTVVCDVEQFVRAAERALREGDESVCARVAGAYSGDVLPASPHES